MNSFGIPRVDEAEINVHRLLMLRAYAQTIAGVLPERSSTTCNASAAVRRRGRPGNATAKDRINEPGGVAASIQRSPVSCGAAIGKIGGGADGCQRSAWRICCMSSG